MALQVANIRAFPILKIIKVGALFYALVLLIWYSRRILSQQIDFSVYCEFLGDAASALAGIHRNLECVRNVGNALHFATTTPDKIHIITHRASIRPFRTTSSISDFHIPRMDEVQSQS